MASLVFSVQAVTQVNTVYYTGFLIEIHTCPCIGSLKFAVLLVKIHLSVVVMRPVLTDQEIYHSRLIWKSQ